PMTPLQQGMLFHRVHGGYAGVDIEQMVGTLREAIDFEAFRRAWDVVAARNPILRTRFAWEGLERPRQEVMREVTTPYALHDLRAFLDEHLPATRDATKEFFRGMLRGFTTPTGLGALARSDANDDAVYGAKKFRLSRATSEALRAIEGVRVAAIVEGVWGLV